MVVALPEGLDGPVEVALARSEEAIPPSSSLKGGALYELKWDGYRVAVVRDGAGARLWSRQGKELTSRFPDLVAAAVAQVEPGTVLDGEAVIWNGSRLDFDLLQRRLVNTPRKVAVLAARNPASLIVFDVLAHRAKDIRRRALRERRQLLEELSAGWDPPLQLSPTTDDEVTARDWMTQYRPAGIEGLVIKAADSVYTPGRRTWIKVKSRESTDVLIGGITGSLERPETIVAGLVRGGELQVVGRSTPLTRDQAQSLATVLTPAGPNHPWPDIISSSRFGTGRDKVPLVKVEPSVVAEVLADAALQAGGYRHPLRFVRARLDLGPEDLS
ncbi:ATP-dependent DNA ligase [Fodinibacter luteus]|uniref:ATP-dependent DNA ligase n=1 Tax=Fodinibacter luteus TaxID=552064 RepID=A0ABP8KMY9_9MICO